MALRTDITEQKTAQKELEGARVRALHSEKMASLGELAASVAHELGNPIGAILSWLEVVADCQKNNNLEEAELHETLPKIQKRASQMQDIIRGMLTYARDGSKDPYSNVNLSAVIRSVQSYLSSKLSKYNIEFDTQRLIQVCFMIAVRRSSPRWFLI